MRPNDLGHGPQLLSVPPRFYKYMSISWGNHVTYSSCSL